MSDRQLLVRKIENGIVIDHIPAGKAFLVLKLLKLDPSARVLIALNVPRHPLRWECAQHLLDLIPFIAQNRQKLVLKPNAEYGGRGVVLGWECEEAHWSEALQNAIDTSYVVQERVPVGRERYPSLIQGEIRFEERYFDLDPYVWEGSSVEGCGVRLSKLALLNVAGGGSAVPMFVLD